ncbi:MAG: efflux RND transporter periplasmic adaptor subunit [Fuerstiella sp.]
MANLEPQSSPVRRLIISEILIVAVLALSVVVFKGLYAQKPEVQEKNIEAVRLNVDVFVSESLDVQELLTGFGTARADRDVVIAAQVSGEIVDINPQLKVGQQVLSGQLVTAADGPSVHRNADLLLKIDSRDLQQKADQAGNSIEESLADTSRLKVQQKNLERQLQKSKSILATLEEEYERIRDAESKRVATRSDLNRALLDVQRYEESVIQLENQVASIPLQIQAAEQRLNSSRAEKSRAENDLGRTEVYPPFDGVLSEVFVEKGRYVRAGEQLARLTDVSKVEIPVSLGFDDFLQLQNILSEGTKPKVSISENETAAPRWTGFMVRAAPEADSLSRTVQVYVEVENEVGQTPLLPGAFVYSRIDGSVFNDVTLVPREAITDGCVYVVDEQNIVRKRNVTTGRRFQSLIIVESGLSSGERVVLTNLDIVKDGEEVVVQTTVGPKDEIAALRSPSLQVVYDSISEVDE